MGDGTCIRGKFAHTRGHAFCSPVCLRSTHSYKAYGRERRPRAFNISAFPPNNHLSDWPWRLSPHLWSGYFLFGFYDSPAEKNMVTRLEFVCSKCNSEANGFLATEFTAQWLHRRDPNGRQTGPSKMHRHSAGEPFTALLVQEQG